TMPQLIMDKIAACILSDSPSDYEFEALSNLRMVNRACFKAVEAFLGSKSNIPQLDSISFTGMEQDRTSFTLEIRLSVLAAPLHPALKDLRCRIASIKREEGRVSQLFCLSIPVRNRKDTVLKCISESIGHAAKTIAVQNLRSIEELKFISGMLGSTKIRRLRIKFESLIRFDDTLSDELISTIRRHAVSTFQINVSGRRENQTDPG
ncbi:hypothetical protein PMAYCL1PPCAC_10178, partial [Pristionchus mayeri]